MASSTKRVTQKIVETFNSIVKGQISEPIKLLKQVISETEKYSNIRERSLLYSLLADLYYEQNKFDDAYRMACRAYSIDSKRKEVLHSLMNIYLTRNNNGNGNGNDNNSHNNHNNNSNANNGNMNISNKYENNDKAKEFAFKLETGYPNDIQALNMASVCYTELGDYDSALRVLLTAHKLLLQTEASLRRCSLDSNFSMNSNFSVNGSVDDQFDSGNNDNNGNKSLYRQTIEETITKTFLARYRVCPDSENFKIMEYLIELIQFKYHTLNGEQLKMAEDEICERAEYILQTEMNKNNFVLCQRAIKMVSAVDTMSVKLICKICAFYESSNQLDLGIKYFSQLIDKCNVKYTQQRAAFHYKRGELYKLLGMTQESQKDIDTASQLSKLRTSSSMNMASNNNNNNNNNGNNMDFDNDMFENNNNNNRYDSKEEDTDSNNNHHSQNKNNFNNNNNGNMFMSNQQLENAIDNESDNSENENINDNRNDYLPNERKDSYSESGNYAEDADYKEECMGIRRDFEKISKENIQLKGELFRDQQTIAALKREKDALQSDLEKLRESYELLSSNNNNSGNSSMNTSGRFNDGECDCETVDMATFKEKEKELESTQERLEYFREKWADYRTKYDNAQDIIAELRMELSEESEKRKLYEKELNIFKDANSKNKMKMRRRSNQIGNNNDNVMSQNKKHLIASDSPWIDRARIMFQQKDTIDGNSASVDVSQSPNVMKTDHNDEINNNRDGDGGNCNNNNSDLIYDRQEFEAKMQKINDECNELNASQLKSNSNMHRSSNDDGKNNGCIESLFSFFVTILLLIALLYCVIVIYNAFYQMNNNSNDTLDILTNMDLLMQPNLD